MTRTGIAASEAQACQPGAGALQLGRGCSVEQVAESVLGSCPVGFGVHQALHTGIQRLDLGAALDDLRLGVVERRVDEDLVVLLKDDKRLLGQHPQRVFVPLP